MIRIIYNKKLCLNGKAGEVAAHLKELSYKYNTLKEFIEQYTKPMLSGNHRDQ